ncbi:MAG: response regulator [Bacteroidia bacterium]|jgi:DNA-binding response OmpR family regulator|nr:response regulator [Bacteroidia bacterium]
MTKQKKVLLADDEPNILLSLDFLMRKQGYEVFIARNGSEALEIIRKQKLDLAVLDIMMPDIDGYQLCEFIKSNASYQHCKVLFLSAKSKEADIERGLGMGADAYMTKPFSTRSLSLKIQELLLD